MSTNMELLIGTHNTHKTREIAKLLEGLPVQIRDLTSLPKIGTVEEDGETLLENAVKKAKHYGNLSGLATIADDTGLGVEALNGEPGVKSARYAGQDCSYDDNNLKLLKMLSQTKNGSRSAVFKCVIALYDPGSGKVLTEEGALKGEILHSPRGQNGFGYDPVFYLPEAGKTLAELSPDEKNRVSHRAIALFKMKKRIERILKETAGKR